MVFCYDLKPAPECAVSAVSWKGLQSLPVSGLGLPGSNHEAIQCWLLSVLDLEVRERGHTVNRAWLLPVLGLGQFSERPREFLNLPLLASWL